MPTPLENFKGLDLANWGSGWPPDSNGDVGPNHYIQAVNTSIGILSKSGTLQAAFTFDYFFEGTGTPCDGSNRGDPIVLYDSLANRWLIGDFAWTNVDNGPYYECIAVSKTADPISGGWWQYALLAHPTYLNDYPKLAVWSDAYYMSANLFDLFNGGTGYTWQGVRVWALNRDDMISGAPAVRNVFFDLSPSSGYGSLLPSHLHGAPPPAGTPNFFASIDEPNLFHLWKFHVDWNTPANSTFTGPTDLTVANFVMPCDAANILACVPQQGGEAVDALGDRLMMQLQYRNIGGVESLWANHTVANSSVVGHPTGIRWYEIRNPNGTPVVYQQGTFQPDT
ncbi:MAG: hypothetical protein Q8O57_06195, partial [Kiritimatiellota bacterium]|nr:hypothetical protein [Kiritimatiellota bacterium]